MKKNIAVVGLGYVGLPLALEFGKTYPTVGFDIAKDKVFSYQKGIDPMGEVSQERFNQSKKIIFSFDKELIKEADFIIITVPTPVDDANVPDLSPLREASLMVGSLMKKGAIVVYESTVYPGATEEECIPILERASSFKWKLDFNVGYSPERVNPGDKKRTLDKVVKVVAGDCDEVRDILADLYGRIISAGIHVASSIKVAEASKVIENTQRDLNIALMNELAILFDKLGIDTAEVLQAAGTKWNFLPFKPGLVGGHCIGVDPYYLTHKAESLGYHPEVILAGRRINDSMPEFVAKKTIQNLIKYGNGDFKSPVIILGITFKENCSDIRNSKVVDLYNSLISYGLKVYVSDPLADSSEVYLEYGINLTPWEALPMNASAILIAVAHQNYIDMAAKDVKKLLKEGGLVVDIKSILEKAGVEKEGFTYWRL